MSPAIAIVGLSRFSKNRRGLRFPTLIAMSQWYVFPRDMCAPEHISLVICVSSKMAASDMCFPSPPPLQIPNPRTNYAFYCEDKF